MARTFDRARALLNPDRAKIATADGVREMAPVMVKNSYLLAPPSIPLAAQRVFLFILQHILERPFRSVSAVGVLRSVAPSPHTQGVGVIDETPLSLSGTSKTNES